MRSEQQHIDDFFRKKEKEYQEDTGQADIHWEEMRRLLKPGITPAPKKYHLQATRRIIKYLGGFTVVTVITLVTLTTMRSKKKAPVTKNPATKTMAAPQKKQPASPLSTASRKTVPQPVKKVVPQAATGKAASTPPTLRKPVVSHQTPGPKPATAVPNSQTLTTDHASLTPAPVTERSLLSQQQPKKEEVPDRSLQTVSSATAVQQINNFYRQLQKEGNRFEFNVNKDTILTGKEGTRLVIPAMAFANKKGVIRNEKVTIVLREYYTYDDMVAARLSTTAGGEQLISGGMVHIDAQVNGEPVNIAAGKNIKLEMPTKQFDEQMQLFRGTRSSMKNAFVAKFMDNRMIDTIRFFKREADENGDIDWTPQGQEQKFSDPLNRRIRVLDPYGDPYHVVRGKKVKAWFYVAKKCPYTNAEMKEKLKAHSHYYFDVVKIRRVNAVPMANYQYREDRVSIAGDTVEMTFQQAMRKKLLTPEDSIRVLEKMRADSISLENRHRLMSKYSFTITNLGWFNCDKYNNSGPKVRFAFKTGEGFEPSGMVAHLVFTRYKSVMSGTYKDNQIQFGRVPKNEAVKIVCIGIKNGKVMSCIRSLNTDQEEISDLVFQETTPGQFKQDLQSLNLLLP